jgi:hypothetical protein
MKTLLASGCSFTKDNYQKTWADYLAEMMNYDLKNIAARGSGINFLSKRIIFQCLKEKPDLVVIMLPSLDRFDWYIDLTHTLHDSATQISSWQNGTSPALVQLDGSLSSDEGYILSGGEIRGDKKYWYKYYYNESAELVNYWNAVYALENFFKQHGIAYYFTMAYDKDHLVEQATNVTGHNNQHQFLFDAIDWDRFIFYQKSRGFLAFARDHGYNIVKHHPVTEAHRAWVNTILIKNMT